MHNVLTLPVARQGTTVKHRCKSRPNLIFRAVKIIAVANTLHGLPLATQMVWSRVLKVAFLFRASQVVTLYSIGPAPMWQQNEGAML